MQFEKKLGQALDEAHVLDIVNNRRKVMRSMVGLDQAVHAFDAALKSKDVGQIENTLNMLAAPLKNFQGYVGQIQARQAAQPQQQPQTNNPAQQQPQQPQAQPQAQGQAPTPTPQPGAPQPASQPQQQTPGAPTPTPAAQTPARPVLSPEAEDRLLNTVVTGIEMVNGKLDKKAALLQGYKRYLTQGGKRRFEDYRGAVVTKVKANARRASSPGRRKTDVHSPAPDMSQQFKAMPPESSGL